MHRSSESNSSGLVLQLRQYRAACRARSRSEFVAKIGVVVEEADETAFRIEFLTDARVMKRERLEKLLTEAHQLTAIFTASRRTAKQG